jgi:hypothetical protein
MPRMKRILLAATALLLCAMAVAQQNQPARTSTCAIPDAPVAITRCGPASIYVADYDRTVIEEVLNRHFDGFTILPARGCWHRLCENSIVIQIAGASEKQLRLAAEELRVAGKQESVLVVIPRR